MITAALKYDNTTRLVTLDLTMTYRMTANEPWRSRTKAFPKFQPNRLVVRFVNGELDKVTVTGPRVLKDGSLSGSINHDVAYGGAWFRLTDMPAWVRELATWAAEPGSTITVAPTQEAQVSVS